MLPKIPASFFQTLDAKTAFLDANFTAPNESAEFSEFPGEMRRNSPQLLRL